MSSTPQQSSSASGAQTRQDISSGAESWVVLDANGSETEYKSNDIELGSVGATHESERYAVPDGGQAGSFQTIANSRVMTSLRNFGNLIKRGLEASKMYNLPPYRPNPYHQPPPPVHQREQTTQQSQQRQSHQQTTQHQPGVQQRQSHQQTTQHQPGVQPRQSHQQTTQQSQQSRSHQQTTQHQPGVQPRQSHQQTTQHQPGQQRQSHQQTTQQSQQRRSHQQTTQHQPGVQPRQSHQQTTQHQPGVQQRQSHQQTTQHQSQQRRSHQQTTQHQSQQRRSHQQTTQHQSQQRCSHQPQLPPAQHPQDQYKTSTVDLPNKLIGRIIYHHSLLAQLLKEIVKAEFSTFAIESNYTKVYLSGTRGCDFNAAYKVRQLVDSITMQLTDELLQLHPMYFPVLTNPEIVQSLEVVKERNLVEIDILRSSGDPASESIYELALQWHAHANCIRVSELENYTALCTSTPVVQLQEWLTQNDEGRCIALPQEVNQHLNDGYYNQKLTKTGFTYNGVQYLVDFQTNTITEVSSGIVQQLQKHPQSVSWSYSIGSDAGYIEHEPGDSEAIEHVYRYGGYRVRLAGIEHTFKFDPTSMCQIDLTTGEKVSLQRKPMPEANTQHRHNITLRIKGLPENVSCTINEVEHILQSATQTIEYDQLLQMFNARHHEMVLAHLTNAARQYCVLFTSSRHGQNGPLCIQIQGDPLYVDAIHNDLTSQCLVLQKCIAATTQQFHPLSLTLTAPPKQAVTNIEIELVPTQSPEWNMVLGMMQHTMSAVRIKSLQRVHHRYQWDRYQLEMRQMVGRGDKINEWYLFHGTRQRDPIDVVQSDRGFDFRCSREDCLWGSGVYFAVNASYSDRYHHRAYNSDLKQVILARVLTGCSVSYGQTYDNTLRRPPELPSGAGLYDTVNGCTHGSFVYVVYDHGKSYKAYVITYK